jgi:uncharacterized protein (TIGR02996 family)
MTDERAFLAAILQRPDDDATKLVYADWLEERGDPRGEYLRLMTTVRQARSVTPEQRQRHRDLSAELAALRTQEWRAWTGHGQGSPSESRERRRRVQELECQLASLSKEMRQQIPHRLQELAATFDPNWLAVVSDPEIEGCGKGKGWQPRFDFVCDKTWSDLRPTGNDTVRHCEACGTNVHFCDNLADAREHSQEGHCIAVDLGVIRRDGDLAPRRMILGRPSRETMRSTYQEDIDPVSRTRLDARKPSRTKRARGQ